MFYLDCQIVRAASKMLCEKCNVIFGYTISTGRVKLENRRKLLTVSPYMSRCGCGVHRYKGG